jgi:hypothetical protein
VKLATGQKERGGEVVCQVSKVVTAILAQLAQEPQLRGRVITQLGFLGREFGSRTFDEWICGTHDVIEQPEGRFDLEVMGSTPAASRLLVELPCSDGKVSRASPSTAKGCGDPRSKGEFSSVGFNSRQQSLDSTSAF